MTLLAWLMIAAGALLLVAGVKGWKVGPLLRGKVEKS